MDHQDYPQQVVVHVDNSGPGCLTSCLALIGALIVLGLMLFACGILASA